MLLLEIIDTPHADDFVCELVDAGDVDVLSKKRVRAKFLGHMSMVWNLACAAQFKAFNEAQYVCATNLVADGGASAAAS